MQSDASAALDFWQGVEDIIEAKIGWGSEDSPSKPLIDKALARHGAGDKSDPKAGASCAHAGCDKKPIRNSHTISKAIGIRPLAEEGHVLTPIISDYLNPRIMRIGTSKASTFNGYCRTHEDMFNVGFEQLGRLTTPYHYSLQIMRSAAREAWKKSAFMNYMKMNIQAYDAGIQWLPIPVEEKQMWTERIVKPLRTILTNAASQRLLLNTLHYELAREMTEKTPLPPQIHVVKYHSEQEVAMSGSTYFINPRGLFNGKPVQLPSFTIVLTVIPNGANDGKKLMLVGTASEHAETLRSYVKAHLDSDEKRERAVMEWMATGTDHWFASPSWWEALPEKQRQDIAQSLTLI